LHEDSWSETAAVEVARVFERFISCHEIYAFTDGAFQGRSDRLQRTHWDSTLALVEIAYRSSGLTWHQRMLFAGFATQEQAEFLRIVDSDILARERLQGTLLFEWKMLPDDPTGRPIVDFLLRNAAPTLRRRNPTWPGRQRGDSG
jgi:hypothetical protein